MADVVRIVVNQDYLASVSNRLANVANALQECSSSLQSISCSIIDSSCADVRMMYSIKLKRVPFSMIGGTIESFAKAFCNGLSIEADGVEQLARQVQIVGERFQRNECELKSCLSYPSTNDENIAV